MPRWSTRTHQEHVARERENVVDQSTASSAANPQNDDGSIAASTENVRGVTAVNSLHRVTNLDIDGVQVQGPTEGFGSLWRKRYWVRLTGCPSTPTEIVHTWREHFGEFWPGRNSFFGPSGTLDPGDIGLMQLETPGGVQLSSGVIVLDARPESFTLISPEGHIFAGVITFSSFRSGGEPVVQIEIVFRAGDPLFEIGMRLFGHRQEDEFWQQVLATVAGHFGVAGKPEMHAQLLDRRFQWSQAGNITRNALIRSVILRSTAPFARLVKRSRWSFMNDETKEPGG